MGFHREYYLSMFNFATRPNVQTSRLAVMGTIQFAGAVHESCAQLTDHFDDVAVPQAKPLSPGEVLGCTAPLIEGKDALVFVADGRFHLEVGTASVSHIYAHESGYRLSFCRRMDDILPFLPYLSWSRLRENERRVLRLAKMEP